MTLTAHALGGRRNIHTLSTGITPIICLISLHGSRCRNLGSILSAICCSFLCTSKGFSVCRSRNCVLPRSEGSYKPIFYCTQKRCSRAFDPYIHCLARFIHGGLFACRSGIQGRNRMLGRSVCIFSSLISYMSNGIPPVSLLHYIHYCPGVTWRASIPGV